MNSKIKCELQKLDETDGIGGRFQEDRHVFTSSVVTLLTLETLRRFFFFDTCVAKEQFKLAQK